MNNQVKANSRRFDKKMMKAVSFAKEVLNLSSKGLSLNIKKFIL
ncbi:MAG: hypothetical protein KatS3mg091_746 [Patescibacteria group bacterium]|nr:MAG: hypothetical protein KatS3mg091_746 [Patescibacteria group bacterium]